MAYKGSSKYPNLGRNIRNLRKSKGYTQLALAGKLGVTNQSISAWESSLADPRNELLDSLSGFFGVTVENLLDGKITGYDKDGNVIYEEFIPTDDFAELSYEEIIRNPDRKQFATSIAELCYFLDDHDISLVHSIAYSLAEKTLLQNGYDDLVISYVDKLRSGKDPLE